MDDNNYKIDKLEVQKQQQELAVVNFQNIEERTNLTPISFLKEHYSFLKIKDLKNNPNFKFTMAICWSKICALSGIRTEVDSFVVEDMSKMINNVYSELSVEEIYKAFELERHGVYESRTEHFQLFSAEYISSVLKKYKIWKIEMLRRHYIKPPERENTKTISVEEQYEIMNKAITRLYDEFLESEEISTPCIHVFDELYLRKLFPPDTDYKGKYAIAKFQLEKELKAEKSTNRQDRLKIQEVISNLDSDKNEKVLSRAKQLVLKDYFIYLKSISAHVKEML